MPAHLTWPRPRLCCASAAAAARLFAKPWDWMGRKTPFRASYMFSQDYVNELQVPPVDQGGAPHYEDAPR